MARGNPGIFNHSLIIGDTYSPVTAQIKDSDGDSVDLTGVTGVCVVWSAQGEVLLEPTVSLIDAASGTFKWTSHPEDTAELSPGKGRYAVTLIFPDNTETTVLEGIVNIRKRGDF